MRIFCFIEVWDYSHKEAQRHKGEVSRKGAKAQRKAARKIGKISSRSLLCGFAPLRETYLTYLGLGLGLGLGVGLGIGSSGEGLGEAAGDGLGLGLGLPLGVGLGLGEGVWLGVVVAGLATSVPEAAGVVICFPFATFFDGTNVHFCFAPATGVSVNLLPLFFPRSEITVGVAVASVAFICSATAVYPFVFEATM
jgi:hypothetical protein